jgi:hypothetical protein
MWQTCSSTGIVAGTCWPGSYLKASENLCYNCTTILQNCATCSEVTGTPQCDTCVTGKFLNSGTCSDCSSNCNTCTDASTCT